MSEKKIIPRCKDGSRGFIGANGRWQPCCQINASNLDYKKSILNHDAFLIQNSKDLKFHELDLFHLWLDRTEDDFDSALYGCRLVCSNYTENTSHERFIDITNEDELHQFSINNDLDLNEKN